MSVHYEKAIKVIPVKSIRVINPRERGKKKFAQITANIAKLGLKKPVVVTPAAGRNGERHYDLVCGQGRLEAYVALAQEGIPAIVVEGAKEDLLLMGLAESLARRQHSAVELIREIRGMKDRGNTLAEIARKTDLEVSYVRGIIQLLKRGEDRLLQAMERDQLPLTIAITIATADDKEVQRALQDAYEQNHLRGKAFLRARRLIETRRTRGKRQWACPKRPKAQAGTAETLMKAFQEETFRQKLVIQKAKVCETRLLFAVSALRQLFGNNHFVTLLRAEDLDTVPHYLSDQMKGAKCRHA